MRTNLPVTEVVKRLVEVCLPSVFAVKFASFSTPKKVDPLVDTKTWYCVTQQGSSTKLDNLREPIMWRLQYRNFEAYQTLVANFVVNGDGFGTAAVRWFELRTNTDGDWELYLTNRRLRQND